MAAAGGPGGLTPISHNAAVTTPCNLVMGVGGAPGGSVIMVQSYSTRHPQHKTSNGSAPLIVAATAQAAAAPTHSHHQQPQIMAAGGSGPQGSALGGAASGGGAMRLGSGSFRFGAGATGAGAGGVPLGGRVSDSGRGAPGSVVLVGGLGPTAAGPASDSLRWGAPAQDRAAAPQAVPAFLHGSGSLQSPLVFASQDPGQATRGAVAGGEQAALAAQLDPHGPPHMTAHGLPAPGPAISGSLRRSTSVQLGAPGGHAHPTSSDGGSRRHAHGALGGCARAGAGGLGASSAGLGAVVGRGGEGTEAEGPAFSAAAADSGLRAAKRTRRDDGTADMVRG